MSRELVIYTDESTKDGKYFANFYGGVLLRGEEVDEVRERLVETARSLGLSGEVKWQKVSTAYVDRYRMLMDAFFDLVAEGKIKVRIMFTQRRHIPTGLDAYRREHAYHILYHQFLKHAFGLRYCNPAGEAIRLRILMDNLPDKKEKNSIFKSYVAGLSHSREFRAARVWVPADQIAEVRSHDHMILQCLDVALGSIQFRLNDRHKDGTGEPRGNKTVAKESLYRHINHRIRAIHPAFNIGVTTGTPQGPVDRWDHPYRHWLFIPRETRIDDSHKKPR